MDKDFICPKCGEIRYNSSGRIKKDNIIEVHLFCHQCETEFIVVDEKESET